MFNIVIFGGPGSGKGTQSDKLISHYNLFHISTGDVLRDHIRRGTDLGNTANSYISKGKLIPDDLMVSILEQVLIDNAQAVADGVIFDGFPRTIPQAEALNEMLQKRGNKVNIVIGLEVPDEELTERLLKRGLESGRSDDNRETIAKRLEVYHSQTAPLKAFYQNQGIYAAIKGIGTIDSIFQSIQEAIDKVK
ncbi:MAG: adenylate kinase [bacterium]|nr:adenylate kinase [bacterium]MDD6027018.1 adenylate kinase [bacterium]